MSDKSLKSLTVERGGGHWQAIPVYSIERVIEFAHWIASEAASRIACWTE